MHGVKFFEISSKCFISASTILGVRVTVGADERATMAMIVTIEQISFFG